MERVIVTTETEDDSLLRSCLFLDDVVGCSVLGDWLALRWSSDDFAELLSGDLGSQVERRRLYSEFVSRLKKRRRKG